MPRFRKGVTPTSSRHIRRLAKQQAAQELKDVKDQVLSSNNQQCSTMSQNNSVENIMPIDKEETELLVTDCISLEDTSCQTLQDSVMESELLEETIQCNREPLQSINQSVSVDNTEVTIRTTTDPLQIRNSFFEFYDDTSDLEGTLNLSDDDRYSDSDADSIPDDDFEFDIDIDVLIRDPKNINDDNFKKNLLQWAISFRIKQNALKELLLILNKYTTTQFCKDSRAFLKTPKSTNVIDMPPGQYCHIGLDKCLKKIIDYRLACKQVFDAVNLLIFIDGAPIAKSSSEKGLWVIFCKDIKLGTVCSIGFYYGISKPNDSNLFLKLFVEEITNCVKNNFTYNNKKYDVRLLALICDSPAKSFVLCTKSHSGYFSCSKCTIEGDYLNSHVAFPLKTRESLLNYCNTYLRTDEEFSNMAYLGNYQHCETILNKIPHVGLISNVPLDSMHLVYLGVMKQLIAHWLGIRKSRSKIVKLSSTDIDKISYNLESLKHLLPFEFNRRSRSLKF